MPVSPRRSDPDSTVCLQVRLPGWLKNQILDAATAADQSLNTWVAAALHTAVNSPAVNTPADTTPTVVDVITDYLHGRTTIARCGKPWPCEGASEEPLTLGSAQFCSVCSIRL